ncbi:hypothetical protein ACHAW5_008308 [Stephanodiscus triporus]|uniref:Uncharacterized protein n=1 Tax=Stephanodiscus triporus TaxID=2934178 RepID=A0ABD3NVZ3_9STRA
MRLLRLIAAAVLSTRESAVCGFSVPAISRSALSSASKLHAIVPNNLHDDYEPNNITRRRSFLSNLLSASSAIILLPSAPDAFAASDIIPSVTSAEFDVILKDSAKSILAVELSGPKSETAIVRLVDGTTFTISDLVESSTDPRSPLKLVARCRLYKIPIKNTGLLSAVSGEGSMISDSGRKKKSYMNPRVQEAEKKEREKRERMAEDERDRLEELYKMEGAEKGFLE